MTNDLTNKHALITGGGTGIGAAIATELAEAGAHVTITGRRTKPLEKLSQTHPLIGFETGDVTDPSSVENMFAGAREQSGPVSIVIANAGHAQSAPIAKTDFDLWQQMINVNLTGTFLTLKRGLEEMRDAPWGRLISIASTAGQKGYPYVSAYCAAKHGVIGLTRALAAEMAQSAITVNAICPGFTQTDMLEQSITNICEKTNLTEDEAKASLTKGNPQNRFIQPQEISAAVMWLVSAGSDSISGQAISVSGGETW